MLGKECSLVLLCLFIFSTLIINVFGQNDEKEKISSILSSSKSVRSLPYNPTVANHIRELIRTYPVMVFSKSYCQHSKRAKDILSKYNLGKNYHVLELDLLTSGSNDYQNELERLTGARTVPRVFIDGKFIGGADKTAEMFKSGELFQRLKQANAFVY